MHRTNDVSVTLNLSSPKLSILFLGKYFNINREGKKWAVSLNLIGRYFKTRVARARVHRGQIIDLKFVELSFFRCRLYAHMTYVCTYWSAYKVAEGIGRINGDCTYYAFTNARMYLCTYTSISTYTYIDSLQKKYILASDLPSPSRRIAWCNMKKILYQNPICAILKQFMGASVFEPLKTRLHARLILRYNQPLRATVVMHKCNLWLKNNLYLYVCVCECAFLFLFSTFIFVSA